jgi:hypothetical protein
LIDFRRQLAVLTEYDENGFIGVQFDAFGEKGIAPPELLHQYGFASRPLDPTTSESGETTFGCEALVGWEGSDAFAFLFGDPRVTPKVPQLKKGGSAQYASDGSFASFDPETHTWTLYVPYAFETDDEGVTTATKAHVITVGRDGNDKPIVELSSGEGQSITMLGTSLVLSSSGGAAYLEITDGGINAIGPFKAASGADLGGPASMPLTKFAPLSAHFTALQAALAAIVAIPANSGVSGAVAAAAATLATFNSAGPTLTTKGA